MVAVVVVVAVAAIGAWLVLSGGDDPAGGDAGGPEPGPTEGTVVAPLTGLEVPESEAASLKRPALVAKVDAAAAAMPQVGLAAADVTIEVRVEGIGRYMPAWHSSVPDEIGPIRSARTSDVDLLGLFVHPLFSYSGGNEGVRAALSEVDWFSDVGHDAVPDAYRRSERAAAPHNLMAGTGMLFDAATGEPPVALFTYEESGEESGGAGSSSTTPTASESVPSQGFGVDMGYLVQFSWDRDAGAWRRWVDGDAHTDPDGAQLAPTNVVVLQVEYVASAADPVSPEALSVGSGPVWVYTAGTVRSGTWERSDPLQPWELRGPGQEVISLEPGRTWVVLAGAPPVELPADQAVSLDESGAFFEVAQAGR